MLCPKCGKESNNLRVCAFCQTPYPTAGSGEGGTPRFTRAVAGPRDSKATPASAVASDPRIAMARRSRTKSWGLIGFLAVFTGGFYFVTRDKVIPVGVAIPNLIAGPMSPNEANAIINTTNRTAQVEVTNAGITVRIPATTFPERRDGQLAFAQQYARADEIVQGHKRLINFIDPTGIKFAMADPKLGVMMSR